MYSHHTVRRISWCRHSFLDLLQWCVNLFPAHTGCIGLSSISLYFLHSSTRCARNPYHCRLCRLRHVSCCILHMLYSVSWSHSYRSCSHRCSNKHLFSRTYWHRFVVSLIWSNLESSRNCLDLLWCLHVHHSWWVGHRRLYHLIRICRTTTPLLKHLLIGIVFYPFRLITQDWSVGINVPQCWTETNK